MSRDPRELIRWHNPASVLEGREKFKIRFTVEGTGLSRPCVRRHYR